MVDIDHSFETIRKLPTDVLVAEEARVDARIMELQTKRNHIAMALAERVVDESLQTT